MKYDVNSAFKLDKHKFGVHTDYIHFLVATMESRVRKITSKTVKNLPYIHMCNVIFFREGAYFGILLSQTAQLLSY